MKYFLHIEKKLEAIGLFLVLASFGWQCFEEHCNQSINEAHIITINKKLDALWLAEKDNAKYDGRFNSKEVFWFSYDINNESFKDWESMKQDILLIESQSNFGWSCRIFLYILGSFLIIIPKWKQ